MAVQAQYPANVLLFNRGETEKNDKEMETGFPPTLEQSHALWYPNGGNVKPRKRGRQAKMALPSATASPQQQQMNAFSLQASAAVLTPAMLGLPQSKVPTPPVISTGLRLTVNDRNRIQNQREQSDSFLSSISEDLAAHINQQKLEMEHFLAAQGEQLRREFAEKRQHHYRILIAAFEKSLASRLRDKEAEVERAARRTAELQNRLAHLHTESMAWQSKAMSEQAAAASLHAQLQQAAAAAEAAVPTGEECCGESPAEDAGSVYVDPDRTDTPNRPCRACHIRPASVVLLPCRHLCVCPACDSVGAADNGCPACGCFRTDSLQVSLF